MLVHNKHTYKMAASYYDVDVNDVTVPQCLMYTTAAVIRIRWDRLYERHLNIINSLTSVKWLTKLMFR